MKETIDLLGKILTNILTALYEPFGFSFLLSFLAMFFYLYAYKQACGVRPQCGQLKPRMLKIQRFWAYILDFYINILTYPPKYVVYRLSNITLPAKYLSIPIRRRYAI